MAENQASIKPADLRVILNYVPKFKGQVFVVALDGSIVDHDNLPNILLDIAVLRSLQINVVIAHGIGSQLAGLAKERGVAISSADGTGPTDKPTLDLAIRASSRVSHQILEGLTLSGLKCAITNSIRSKPVGVLKGEDHQFAGQVEEIDRDFLNHLLGKGIVPILQPIGFDRNGNTLRINSDALAVEVAHALDATKVVYLTTHKPLTLNGKLARQLSLEELEKALENGNAENFPSSLLSKAQQALTAIKESLARIHILDGRIHDALVREIFSNEGVGALIYGNEYKQIRQATLDDVSLIYHLTRSSVDKEELLARPLASIEQNIDHYYIYEIDGNLMACMLLKPFEEAADALEISSLFVHPFHQKRGIGMRLVEFACLQASREKAKAIWALTTQAATFFKDVCDFDEIEASQLPPCRLATLEQSGRRSKVFRKLT